MTSEKQVQKLKEEIENLKEKQKVNLVKRELDALKSQTKHRMAMLITSAFGFVSALFWRDAISNLLEQTLFVKSGTGSWFIQIIVAIIVTLLATIVIYVISRFDMPERK